MRELQRRGMLYHVLWAAEDVICGARVLRAFFYQPEPEQYIASIELVYSISDFSARRYASAIYAVSLRVSVCVCVLLKWLNGLS